MEGKLYRLKPPKVAPPIPHTQKSQGKNLQKAQALRRTKPRSTLQKEQEGNPAKKLGKRRLKDLKYKEVSPQ